MPIDPDRAKAFFRSLSPEQIAEGNRREQANYESQVSEFRRAYAKGHCYLCNGPFDQMRAAHPCTHWLLRRCRFKKKDFLSIAERYDYHNIAAFLRWCANEESLLRNINDLESEKSDRKVISYTVKWKNIDWTFDCTENDMRGHGAGASSHPHYHFQMRIDGRQFINFNEFHVPLSDRDLFNLSLRDEQNAHHSFGAAGSGMQEAVSADPGLSLEHASPTTDEDEAAYHFSTMIDTTDQPLSSDEIHNIFEEAKRTNKSFAFVAKQRLQGRARIQTVISPMHSIPDIANRTEHKPR
ncbi:hypothetical protein VVD49_16095 [Uliginosibacterium sp. H3]|uniref:Replication protein n=1 Tax=Uliginosibacterium silvisoli TaxID=3114758 RepID=A0ABU6K6H2_9RHOO|nr:hypothetical protein [Uliginosibacterium sp. H3]